MWKKVRGLLFHVLLLVFRKRLVEENILGARGESLLVFWVPPDDLIMTIDLIQVELVIVGLKCIN